MQTKRQLGKLKEEQALKYLQQHGLRLITSNYQCKTGEIDLIMDDDNTICFIEVRFRKYDNYGDGAASVTRNKQRKIIRAAKYFLQQHHSYQDYPCRFDVVAITLNLGQQNIEWIKDAFWVQY